MLPIHTNWKDFHFAAGDLQAAWVSVALSALALLIILVFGTPLAYALARYRFRGKSIVEALVLLPLLTPPLAMGLLLASVYGPYGIVGGPLEKLGLILTNSTPAFLLAQVYGAAPYYIVGARSAFEGVPTGLERVSMTLGKGPLATFVRVTFPLARLGLAAGLATAWVRALGEFGIVLIIAYYPRGIPVKLWVNLQDIGLQAVYPLMWLLFFVGLPLPLALGILSRRNHP
jgi:molybdate/tungstate transport system permease protein